LPGDRSADIGLVLVIGGDDLDRLAGNLVAHLLGRHAGGDRRSFAGKVGINPGAIVENADSDDITRNLRQRRAGAKCNQGRCGYQTKHEYSLPIVLA
jgi:hypothetical protein